MGGPGGGGIGGPIMPGNIGKPGNGGTLESVDWPGQPDGGISGWCVDCDGRVLCTLFQSIPLSVYKTLLKHVTSALCVLKHQVLCS